MVTTLPKSDTGWSTANVCGDGIRVLSGDLHAVGPVEDVVEYMTGQLSTRC